MTSHTYGTTGVASGWRRAFLRSSSAALVLASLGGTLAGCGGGDDDPASASAALIDTNGRAVGSARFIQDARGLVHINAQVNGLPSGRHGIHIHAVGVADPNASPPFGSAGGHFNPAGKQHGLDNPNGAHAGDLPNLEVNAAGAGTFSATTDRITLTPGPNSLFDSDGSALIIHAAADDQVTDPTGNSGGRIAGGVIVRD